MSDPRTIDLFDILAKVVVAMCGLWLPIAAAHIRLVT